jgi:uncharacterized membrane protein
MKEKAKEGICQITNNKHLLTQLIHGSMVREPVVKIIKRTHPEWSDDKYIHIDELNKFRAERLRELVEEERGKVDHLEKEVLESINRSDILTENIEYELDQKLTRGQRLADKIASFGGSWPFIITFFVFIGLWMGVNIYLLNSRTFDPYPFILLNLILSCLAAIQAPIIMMSQNRKEEKDRQRSENDYQINLKSELGIQVLQEKIDHLISEQGKTLMEIQQIQLELMEEIIEKVDLAKTTKE